MPFLGLPVVGLRDASASTTITPAFIISAAIATSQLKTGHTHTHTERRRTQRTFLTSIWLADFSTPRIS
jgi:hypothetical protein